MAELTLSEYAERKGISIHTARRRMKRGDLTGRLEGGRYIVTVPDEELAPSGEDELFPDAGALSRMRGQAAARDVEAASLRQELSDSHEMTEEMRRQRDLTDTRLAEARQEVREGRLQVAKLRRLLGQAQRLLRGAREKAAVQEEELVSEAIEIRAAQEPERPKRRRGWWPFRR
jgi:DNA repair exonuclease SbcCD ATPase subunit